MNRAIRLKKQTEWSAALVKMLRGKRTQGQLGKLLGVPKNTVWRWEAGYARPDPRHTRRLERLAERERFLKDWNPVGSLIILGDLEEGSRQIGRWCEESLESSALLVEEGR